jgi:cytosine/adenosine deaminase-related metal-dependent hydrolase
MKFLALLAAVADPEPGPPDALQALRAATVGGARTAGWDDRIGALRPGMKADIAILDLADPAFVPLNSLGRQLVYSECGRGVLTVIVDGRIVMEDRVVKTVDEAALREAVVDAMKVFRPDAEAVVARHERLTPHILEADRRIWAHDVGVHRYVGR